MKVLIRTKGDIFKSTIITNYGIFDSSHWIEIFRDLSKYSKRQSLSWAKPLTCSIAAIQSCSIFDNMFSNHQKLNNPMIYNKFQEKKTKYIHTSYGAKSTKFSNSFDG